MKDEDYLSELLKEHELIKKNKFLHFLNVISPLAIFFAFLFLVICTMYVIFHHPMCFQISN